MRQMGGNRRQAGFSLVECLVGLAVLAVALLMGISLLGQEARALERLEAHADAWSAVEMVTEMVRGGALPLASQTTDPASLGASTHAVGLTVFVEVEPEGRPGLFRVRVSARYSVRGQLFWRRLSTLVWRSPQ